MRRAAWPALITLLFAPGLEASEPVCCRLFGFDATAMLGPNPAKCGKIVDAALPGEAAAATQAERRRATACALDAQAQGRAFVYTYRLLVAPDIDLIVQAVFGLHGERLVLKLGRFNHENVRTQESCESLAVQPDGDLRSAGCY